MKTIIQEVILSADPAGRHGLGELRIEGMTPVIAIAGPNGSGKSRLLRCIREALEIPNKIHVSEETIRNREEKIASILSDLDHPGFSLDQRNQFKQQVVGLETEILQTQRQMANFPKIVMEPRPGVKLLELKTKRPEMLTVSDAKNSDFVYATSMLGQISNFDEAMKNAKRRIFKISLDNIAANSTAVEHGDADIDAQARYMDLDNLVTRLLQQELRHDIDNSVTLFGKGLDDANLSDGQSLLLQFAAALFAVEELEPCVVLLDEPETHLHPGAQIALLEELKRALPNAQIIIATHSVPLLAHIGVGNIWSMNKGRLSRSGKDVQEVLTNLMGGSDDVNRMRDFIDEPARIAAVDFARECLMEPQPAEFKANDPQQDQMIDGLNRLWSQRSRLTVLDWGAGKGRLATALRERLLLDKEHAPGDMEYFAYNPYCSDEDRESCLRAMSLLNPANADDHFLTSRDAAHAAFDERKADAVILCNCLHEIEPKYWTETFASINRCLAEDGVLIMVEDLEIPVGELAFPHGFFLLDAKGMAALLDVKMEDFQTSFHHDARYNNRLVRYTVPKRMLALIGNESVKAAIEQGKRSALENIERLRNSKPDFKSMSDREARLYGRRHGLFAQQVANAILFLEGRSEEVPAIER